VGSWDRLSGLDASFLHLEDGGAHMHVGSVLVFEGEAPAYEDFVAHVESRLRLVPRYRQKLAFPPLPQSRPVWVDDPHFNIGYHVRHTALPAPAGEVQLRRLAGRLFAQRLDRAKPLWEVWLVGNLGDGRFAIVAKTHHALVDGISGVDIITVLFDLSPEPPEPAPPSERAWFPRPEPSGAALLADALAERSRAPLGAVRTGLDVLTHPDRTVGALAGLGSVLRTGVAGAPRSPLNVKIGPHRRFTWVDADLQDLRTIKSKLGGTVNDVVLAVVSAALRGWYEAHGHDTDGVTLRAMVPMSVRANAERGALGNRVTVMSARLPIHAADPLWRFRIVHEEMGDLKASGQAVGAEVLTRLTGFAPPTIVAQAMRLQTRQRFYNLTVTNVPGPQFPLYVLGRRMRAAFPLVPLARNTALGIAILSYDGRMGFGLVSDYDAVPDLERLADNLGEAIGELKRAAG
jgi:diacylglycerol O-acyltransferase